MLASEGLKGPTRADKARSAVLIDSLLEAGDLFSQVVDLVFEVFFSAANAGVAGFDYGAEAVYGADDRSAEEAG